MIAAVHEQNRLLAERLRLTDAETAAQRRYLEALAEQMRTGEQVADAAKKALEDVQAGIAANEAAIRRVTDRIREMLGLVPEFARASADVFRSSAELARSMNEQMGLGAERLRTIALPDPQALAEMQARLQQTLTALAGQDPTQSIISRLLWGGQEPQAWTDGFAAAMAEIDRVGRASGQTATQIANQRRALMLREQDLIRDTASLMASTLTAVFKDNKAAAIAAAFINTAVAITRALQLPHPFNWIQAGLIAASGGAQIAAIQSAQPGGASSPSVGGGAGGGVAEPTQATPSQSLLISLAPGRYSHQEVEALIEGINERVGQGVTLIATEVK
jgi:hypothetical protein